MENKPVRTDPRVLRTRQMLKDALVEILQEMDIEKITVNRIAERATINRVTFYLHFKDIPDMLEKVADEMVEDIRSILHRYVDSTEEDDFSMLISLLEHIEENAKFYKVVLGSRRTPIFTERLLKLLTEFVMARVERAGPDSFIVTAEIQNDIAIWYGSSALIGTIVAWLKQGMPYTPQYLAKQYSMLRALKFK